MNLSKCIKIFLSLFLCFLLFTGCTGNRHLKDLFIVEGLGIDYYDNNLSVTIQGLKVNMSNASDTPLGNMVVNTSAGGATVSSAINNTTKAVSKRAFFGHNKIIVLSKELAQNEYASVRKKPNLYLKVRKMTLMFQAKIYFFL